MILADIALEYANNVLTEREKEVQLLNQAIVNKDSTIGYLNQDIIFLKKVNADTKPAFYDHFSFGVGTATIAILVVYWLLKP